MNVDRMYLDPAQEGEYQAVEYVRGDLIVHININWMSVNKETWLKLLKVRPSLNSVTTSVYIK